MANNIDFKERHKYTEKAAKYHSVILYLILDKTIHYDKYSESISIRTLSSLSGYSLQTVCKQVKQLADMKVLSVTSEQGKKTVFTVNNYEQWQQVQHIKKHAIKRTEQAEKTQAVKHRSKRADY